MFSSARDAVTAVIQVELKADINAFDGVGFAGSDADWAQGVTPAGLAQAHGHFR